MSVLFRWSPWGCVWGDRRRRDGDRLCWEIVHVVDGGCAMGRVRPMEEYDLIVRQLTWSS